MGAQSSTVKNVRAVNKYFAQWYSSALCRQVSAVTRISPSGKVTHCLICDGVLMAVLSPGRAADGIKYLLANTEPSDYGYIVYGIECAHRDAGDTFRVYFAVLVAVFTYLNEKNVNIEPVAMLLADALANGLPLYSLAPLSRDASQPQKVRFRIVQLNFEWVKYAVLSPERTGDERRLLVYSICRSMVGVCQPTAFLKRHEGIFKRMQKVLKSRVLFGRVEVACSTTDERNATPMQCGCTCAGPAV